LRRKKEEEEDEREKSPREEDFEGGVANIRKHMMTHLKDNRNHRKYRS